MDSLGGHFFTEDFMAVKLISYDEHVKKQFQDDEFVLAYLKEVLEPNEDISDDIRKKLIKLFCENLIKARVNG